MDSERFDDMTRRLATSGTTRRRLLRTLGGAMSAAVLAGLGVRPAVIATQDSSEGAHAVHGRRAGQALSAQVAGVCDNCDWVCSNCPIGCCAA